MYKSNKHKFVGCVFAYIGRALEWHSRGQEFDPLRLHHSGIWCFIYEKTATKVTVLG